MDGGEMLDKLTNWLQLRRPIGIPRAVARSPYARRARRSDAARERAGPSRLFSGRSASLVAQPRPGKANLMTMAFACGASHACGHGRVHGWANVALGLGVALLGCKSKEPPEGSRSMMAADDRALSEARPEPDTIVGSADGKPFTNAAAFFIESPDVDSTTVIYVFSRPMRCLDLSFSGWDQELPQQTTFLELKVFAREPGALPAVTAEAPGPGEAVASYTRSAGAATPNETRATGGTVTLAAFAPGTSATVTFSLVFGTHRLMGNVTAVYCLGGHEP
jgi:hypothetical protein